MTLVHELSFSGPWAPLLFHDEAVTFCNLAIWWRRPRLGWSLGWAGNRMGNAGLLLSTKTPSSEDVSFWHGLRVGGRLCRGEESG